MDLLRPAERTVVLVALVGLLASCSGNAQRSNPAVMTASTGTPAPLSTTTTTSAPTPTSAPTAPPSTASAPTATPEPAAPPTTALACGDLKLGVSDFTLTAGGGDHPVRVFVPSAYLGAALPLVVNWHGLGGDGPQQAAVTRYEELAEAEGFIVVHPTGVASDGDSRTSWQLSASTDDRDDVVFANELLDHLIADWCADANRIYSTGVSNGGFFTARLVCEIADRLAAATSVAGLYHPDACAPSRPVPYLAYHGTDDTVVPFDGDGESVLLGAASDPALQVFFEQVIPEEFAEFAADAECDLTPVVSTIDDVIRHDYVGCAGDTPMSFFEVTGGGHTWPNWPIAGAVEPLLGYTTTTVDATVDSWEFFRHHTLAD